MKFLRQILISILTLATLTSVSAAQEEAPPSWHLLQSITYTEHEDDSGRWWVEKFFPPELTAHSGPFTISGYYVPVQAQAYVSIFLLVPDDASCPFCGASGYGIALEVHTTRPLPDMPEGTLLTMSGDLKLLDDPETYQAAKLLNARVLD